ncbi:MAG: endolytic transglycosylase MltG [Streptosporangiales bacterium]|nr:endolytic transglycosylase MltG [Streptosporangiales bacterium]
MDGPYPDGSYPGRGPRRPAPRGGTGPYPGMDPGMGGDPRAARGPGGRYPGDGPGFDQGGFGEDAWPGDDGYDDGPRGRKGRGRTAKAGKSGKRESRRQQADEYAWDDFDSQDGNPVPMEPAPKGKKGRKGKAAKRKRGPVRRLAPWIALVVLLAIVGVPGYYLYNKYYPADYSGPGTAPQVTVEVPQGGSAFGLASTLANDGVVKSSRAFVLAAEHSTSQAGLIPGTYKLNRHMQASLAYAALLNPKNRDQLTFTIKEGQRVAQVLQALSTQMHRPLSQFTSIVNSPSQLGLPSYAKSNVTGVSPKVIGYKVEGFLYPSTYDIQPHDTPLQVLQSMVKQYTQVTQASNLQAGAQARGLTPYAVLIEASMVQAEAGTKAQMPKIAEVIKNRFAHQMPLGFDSVLQYGQNSFALNIRDGQSSIPGPYNDFQHATLPPTPISNPGMDAINAVLHPASGPWLYFLAQPDGSSIFCVHQPANASAKSCPAGG